MKIVKNWQNAWRWFSVQCLTLSLAINGAWAAIPTEWRETVSADYLTYGTIALMVLGTIGRLVDQGGEE